MLAAVIVQQVVGAVALPHLNAPPWVVWIIYLGVLAVLTPPLLACLASVRAGADAQTAEDTVRRLKAQRELASLLGQEKKHLTRRLAAPDVEKIEGTVSARRALRRPRGNSQ